MGAIELDVFFPHPPVVVWEALTDRDLLGRWLMPNDFEPRVGHRFTFDRGGGESVRCKVLELEPERLLSYTWVGRRRNTDSPFETTVTWRLVEEGRGTRLFLLHDGFDEHDPQQKTALDLMGGGWKSLVLPGLERLLDELAEA